MSTTIDQRVVEMRFDNRQFESNVATTMSTLDKLKKALTFGRYGKQVESEFASYQAGIVSTKDAWNKMWASFEHDFAMWMKRTAKYFGSDPITKGFSEYETQIGAIQTILSNTKSKGTTLDDVNSALDELNTYADKTIYNFTEMTRNIGTFTAAGVDLDTSVSAIKGIANLAAVSGSTSQQASTAMYQLSQAMATGTVRLMDWNSVVNAGMGGQVFQDSLKETAKVHGIAIDDIIKRQGSFRDSLSEGWLSTEILTETLAKFTGDLTEEQLKAIGYTDEQIKGILELGKDANDAATKVKTFTQLIDTLGEAAQSGWAQTWEIIIGDFEEAKDLLTKISDSISGLIVKSAEARNDLLENWKVLGGRDDLIEGLNNLMQGLANILGAVRDAFNEVFPPFTAETLFAITEGFKNLTAKLKNISGGTLDKLKRTFKGVFALVDIGVLLFKALARGVGELLGHLAPAGNGLLGFTAGLGDALVALRDFIESSGIFNIVIGKVVDILGVVIKIVGKVISVIVSGFKALGSLALPGIETFVERIQTRFWQLRNLGEKIKQSFSSIGNFFKGLFSAIAPLIKSIGEIISNFFTSIKNAFKDFEFDTVVDGVNVGIVGVLALLVKKLISVMSALEKGDWSSLFKNFKGDFFNKIKDGISNVMDGVTGCFKAFQSSLKAEVIMKIAKAIAILAVALVVLSLIDSEKLTFALAAISAMFIELFMCLKMFESLDMVKAKKGEFTGIQSTANSLISIAVTILILAFAISKLGKMSPEALIQGLFATMMLLMTLAFSMQYFAVGIDKTTKKAEKSFIKGTGRLIGIAVTIMMLASVVKTLGNLKFATLVQGMVGLTALIGAMALAAAAMKAVGRTSISSAASMIIVATALLMLAGVLKVIGLLKWSEIGKGLVVIAASLILLSAGLRAMSGTLFGSAALMVASGALVMLAGALVTLSLLSWGGILKSLVAVAGMLIVLSAGLTAMMASIPGAVALTIASAALLVLGSAMALLGALSWGTIIKSLVGLAATFAVFGVAAYVLKPLIPTIFALAAALAVIGIGVAAAGVGITLLSTSLTAFAIAFVASVPLMIQGIKGILTGLISLIPAVLQAFTEVIIGVCDVIINASPKIGEALISLVGTLCDVLLKCVPKIVVVIFELLVKVLEALASYTPAIVDSLFKFIIGLLQGIARHMPALIQALVDVLMAIFQGAIDALKNVDTDVLIEGILSIGILAVIAGALAAIAPLIPLAMIGALGLVALIAELSILLSAVGALAQIPGLAWLVGEGGKLMVKIGEAIGGFIGSIIGSALEGISASFPQIGTDLSNFMKNVQPFIDGSRAIGPETLDGAKTLVGIILALTAANVIESLTSWFTGGTSLAEFGNELVPFGEAMVAFSEIVSGKIDEGAVSAAANAGKTMAEMAATLPNTGGVVGWFAGENDLEVFAAKLIPFGEAMVAFSTIVSGKIDEGAVTSAANAGKAMAEMASTIPNSGGVVGFFAGENDIDTFGAKLIPFGMAMAAFSAVTTGKIDEGVILAAANAGKAMSEMAATLPNSGGVVSWFTGENDIDDFGEKIVKFGYAMVDFSAAVSGKIDEGAVTAAANAGSALATLASTLPNSGGFVSLFTGDNNIDDFGERLVDFGSYLASYSQKASGINLAAVENSRLGMQHILDLANNASGVDFGGLASLGQSLDSIGKSAIDKFCKAFSNAKTKVETAAKTLATNFKIGFADQADSLKKTFNAVAKKAVVVDKTTKTAYWNAGADLARGFAQGIDDTSFVAKISAAAMAAAAVAAAKLKLDINSPSRVFRELGGFLPEGFAQGIDDMTSVVTASSTDMADSAIDGVNGSISHLADLVSGDLDTQPTIRPVLDLSDVESGAGAIGQLFNDEQSVGVLANVGAISGAMNKRNQNGALGELLSAFDGLRKDLSNVEHTTYNINGVSYEESSDVASAFKTIVREARIERRR